MKSMYIAVLIFSISLSAYCLNGTIKSMDAQKALEHELYAAKSEIWKYKTELIRAKGGYELEGSKLIVSGKKISMKYFTKKD